MFTWFASEYIALNRYKWRDWLAGILHSISGKIEKVPGHKFVKVAMRKLKATLVRSARVVRRSLVPRRLVGAGFDRSYRSPVISLSTDITTPGPDPMALTTPTIRLPLSQGERHSGNAAGIHQILPSSHPYPYRQPRNMGQNSPQHWLGSGILRVERLWFID